VIQTGVVSMLCLMGHAMSEISNIHREKIRQLRSEFAFRHDPLAKQLRVEAHARWWHDLGDQTKCYLLTRVCLDEWERWHGCAWGALPEKLRMAIGRDTIELRRELAGLAWT
jgi:hypothetical protein